MIATLVFTFTNINLAQDEPLRFVGLDNYADAARRPAGLGVAGGHAQVRRCSGCRSRSSCPFAVALAAQQPAPAGLGRVPGPVLPALRGPVRGRRPHLAGDAQPRDAAGSNGFLRFIGVANPPNWLQDPTWIYPGLVFIGIWGIGAGIIVNLAGLRGIPTELYDAAQIDGAGWWAAAAPRDPADDVAGHLLHARPRHRGGAPVLPRPAGPQQRAPASRAARRSSSTSTCTRPSSRTRTCPTGRPSPGSCSRSPWSITLRRCSGRPGAGSTTPASASVAVGEPTAPARAGPSAARRLAVAAAHGVRPRVHAARPATRSC